MAKQAKQNAVNDDRAKKTLYVTGFNSKNTTKQLLKELFTQGGPVADITMFDTHAYVRFQHQESVPYCLALFNEVELFGDKLRLNPRHKSDNTFSYMKYLAQVRDKLRDEYMSKEPPKLPAKIYSESPKKKSKKTDHRKSFENKAKSYNERSSKEKKTKTKARKANQKSQPTKKNRSIY